MALSSLSGRIPVAVPELPAVDTLAQSLNEQLCGYMATNILLKANGKEG